MLFNATAFAFGTISEAGQNREHERITRHALQCAGPQLENGCFQTDSLNILAGNGTGFGAVGAPDDPGQGLILEAAAHCDNGDFLGFPFYPHSRENAQAALENCRNYIVKHMISAAKEASSLIDHREVTAIQGHLLCRSEEGVAPSAKCKVIAELGIALHTTQDFYAHTNWVDAPVGAISLISPPGLGKTGAAPWLDLRHETAFPPGLISGCWDGLPPEERHCPGRVKHYVVNKDEGDIDPQIGAGRTPRGLVAQNFQRAVEAAIADTRDKWLFLEERLYIAYGAEEGELMACALTHDHPEGCAYDEPQLCFPASVPNPQRAGSLAAARPALRTRRVDLISQVRQLSARCTGVTEGTALDAQCARDQESITKLRDAFRADCEAFNKGLVQALR